MKNAVKIDPSLIPAAETQLLASTFLKFIEKLSEDPKIMKDFEEWKKRGEHLKYQL